MLVLVFAGCTKIKAPDTNGAIIHTYMGTKVLNLDPAVAYTDENAVKLISLIFEGLMKINKNGSLEKALASKYEIYTDDRSGDKIMKITLNTTYWSDGSLAQANDVVYAWKRILDPDFSSQAASLLYCIKGARDAKLGKIGIDDIGLYAIGTKVLEVRFEEGADTDEFLYNLASPALVPLRENKISLYPDTWSRSNTDLSSNGPFRVRKFSSNESETMILERSKYYYRNAELSSEEIDKSVTPYRIYVHFSAPLDSKVVYSKTETTDIVTLFNQNDILFASGLTQNTAPDFTAGNVKTSALMSTYSYYFNTANKPFDNASVRYALSIALDRSSVASLIGGGTTAATGLVPPLVFDTKKGTSFRKVGGEVLSSSANIEEAKSILSQAGINPASYGDIFLYYISDVTNDSYYSAQLGFKSKEKVIAEQAEAAWEALGFSVVLKGVSVAEYEKAYQTGDYDIIGLDVQAISTYAFHMLSPYSKAFSGSSSLLTEGSAGFDASLGFERYYVNNTHSTGYYSEAYDAKLEEAFAATTQKEKAALLHEAEALLLKDAPVIPVVFNSETYAVSKLLSNIEENYFGAKTFTKTEVKDYLKYYYIDDPAVKPYIEKEETAD